MKSIKQLKISYNIQVFPILSNSVTKSTDINLDDLKIQYKDKELLNPCLLPSVYKGIHASSTVFWRLSALTSIGVRPVRLIPLPCQPPKDGTWGPEEFCATDLRFCKALE